MSETQEAVRRHYAGEALRILEHQPAGCCDSSAHGSESSGGCCGSAYSADELAAIGLDEGVSLGCGNPLLLAGLRPGEDVLDLGSGGGLDVLLSARRVAPGGTAYGVDMTDEMLAAAERNRAAAGIDNARFLKGTIDAGPLPAGSVDVVISNCVVNLAEDKPAVLREAYRVLRPGGRVAISDMVALRELPAALRSSLVSWAGCIGGTIGVEEYARLLAEAGFERVEVDVHDRDSVPGLPGAIGSAYIHAVKPAQQ